MAILVIAQGDGAKKSYIMYSGYLSFKQMKNYLPYLLKEELLSYDARTKIYKTTQKGMNLMQMMYVAYDLMPPPFLGNYPSYDY